MIYGYVFLDLNKDGSRDAGETGIGDVAIQIIRSNAESGLSVLTDHTGYYHAVDLAVDTKYVVTESDPVGYVSTTPNRVVVVIPHEMPGRMAQVSFGDSRTPAGRLYLPLIRR